MTKILIVENNEKNLKLLKIIVELLGYKALLAKHGEEGVRMAKEQIPDLILMDIQMPVMDGTSALKALQSDKKTENIPVIAITSYAMKGDRERLLELGFVGYIAKPIDKNSLIEVVENVLRRKHERDKEA